MRTSPSLTENADQIIHEMALQAGRRINSYRLLLGRCLLEAARRRYYVDFGCSNLNQYIVHILKLNKKEARACLRVAIRLEELPRITYEAERGMIGWSKLRDTLHKVTPETEEFWLELYTRLTYSQVMHLAARTRWVAFPEIRASPATDPRPPSCPVASTPTPTRWFRVDCERSPARKAGWSVSVRRWCSCSPTTWPGFPTSPLGKQCAKPSAGNGSSTRR